MTVVNQLIGLGTHALLIPLEVCPTPIPGAEKWADNFTGYALWVLSWTFGIATLLSVATILVGKIFHMSHVTKGGVVALFVVIGAALASVLFPDIVTSIIGDGCID